MKHFLFVVFELPPLGGGVGRAASALLNQWQHSSFKIDVITSSLTNSYEQERFSDNITIYKVPIGQKPPHLQQVQTPKQMFLFTFFSFKQIKMLLKHNQYEKALYFGYPSALIGRLFRSKVPYVVSLRGVDVPGYNPKFDRFYWLYKPLSCWIWRGAKAVIANSEWLKNLALQTAKLPIEVIPNGVETKLFKPVAENKKFDIFAVTAGGTVMGSKKGLRYLVEGFAQFHQQHPQTQLRLFGTGDEEESLRQLVDKLQIKEAVKFVGQVSHDELAQQLPRCHVFCLPSLAEGMSNAMLEAAACGLPIIATNVGGAAELIDGNGVIIKQKSASDIADSLVRIYNDNQLRVKMGAESREKAAQFGWEEVGREWVRVLE